MSKPLDDRQGRAEPRRSVHLYAIAGLWTRRVKLGRSYDPEDRWSALQCGSGEELILIAVAHDMGLYEDALHEALAKHRLHGEWFSPEVTQAIVEVAPLTDNRRDERFAAFVEGTVTSFRRERSRTARAAVRMLDSENHPRGTFRWRGKDRPL